MMSILEIPKASKRTRERLERILSMLQNYRAAFFREEVKITSNYEERFHGQTNIISKPVENVAINNADREQAIKRMIVLVEAAVKLLDPMEKRIIEETFFQSESHSVVHICMRLNISDATHYRWKKKALDKMAWFLREWLDEEPQESIENIS